MDAWICNTDRHEYNWGFLLNSETPMQIAPNYDNNLNLFDVGTGRKHSPWINIMNGKKDPQSQIELFHDSWDEFPWNEADEQSFKLLTREVINLIIESTYSDVFEQEADFQLKTFQDVLWDRYLRLRPHSEK
jgi:hypothetical protein